MPISACGAACTARRQHGVSTRAQRGTGSRATKCKRERERRAPSPSMPSSTKEICTEDQARPSTCGRCGGRRACGHAEGDLPSTLRATSVHPTMTAAAAFLPTQARCGEGRARGEGRGRACRRPRTLTSEVMGTMPHPAYDQSVNGTEASHAIKNLDVCLRLIARTATAKGWSLSPAEISKSRDLESASNRCLVRRDERTNEQTRTPACVAPFFIPPFAAGIHRPG